MNAALKLTTLTLDEYRALSAADQFTYMASLSIADQRALADEMTAAICGRPVPMVTNNLDHVCGHDPRDSVRETREELARIERRESFANDHQIPARDLR